MQFFVHFAKAEVYKAQSTMFVTDSWKQTTVWRSNVSSMSKFAECRSIFSHCRPLGFLSSPYLVVLNSNRMRHSLHPMKYRAHCSICVYNLCIYATTWPIVYVVASCVAGGTTLVHCIVVGGELELAVAASKWFQAIGKKPIQILEKMLLCSWLEPSLVFNKTQRAPNCILLLYYWKSLSISRWMRTLCTELQPLSRPHRHCFQRLLTSYYLQPAKLFLVLRYVFFFVLFFRCILSWII